MGAESLVDRMLAAEGLVESHSIRTGQLTDEEWQKYTIAQGNLANASIYIDDTPGIRITEIRSRSRKLAQETGNLGLILIDYLQLITGTGRENRQQEVSEISRQLKILAKELKFQSLLLVSYPVEWNSVRIRDQSCLIFVNRVLSSRMRIS